MDQVNVISDFCISDREYYSAFNFTELQNIKCVELPKFQRLSNEDRIREIYESIVDDIRKGRKPFLPGVIILATLDDKNYLIDGNHRYQAYERVYKTEGKDLVIGVNIVAVSSMNEADQLFRRVNNCTPVTMMPEGVTLEIPNDIIKKINTNYPTYVRDQKIVHRPNIRQSDLLDTIGIELKEFTFTPDTFIEAMEELNKRYSSKSNDYFVANNGRGTTLASIIGFRASIEGRSKRLFLGLREKCRWVPEVIQIIKERNV